MGVAKYLHEKDSKIKIVGVDLFGSSLAIPRDIQNIEFKRIVEGVGQENIPSFLDYKEINEWIRVDEKESFISAREIISKEGLLVGGSSGACINGAFKFLNTNKLGSDSTLRCVVIFPDSIRNYMSKFFNDNWMVGNGYYPIGKLLDSTSPLSNLTISCISGIKPVAYYDKRLTISDCFEIFKNGAVLIPIREKGEVIGVVTPDILLKNYFEQKLNLLSS
jgi:cystathionine beta-synthase